MIRKHIHIGAYGIITNNNQIALIRKARGGYTGKLDLPGGGIEHTETPDEALAREIMEETHGKVIKYKLITVASANITWLVKENFYEDLHHLGILYLTEIEDNKITSDPDGIDSLGAAWYDINSLNIDELTPFAKYAINYLKNK